MLFLLVVFYCCFYVRFVARTFIVIGISLYSMNCVGKIKIELKLLIGYISSKKQNEKFERRRWMINNGSEMFTLNETIVSLARTIYVLNIVTFVRKWTGRQQNRLSYVTRTVHFEEFKLNEKPLDAHSHRINAVKTRPMWNLLSFKCRSIAYHCVCVSVCSVVFFSFETSFCRFDSGEVHKATIQLRTLAANTIANYEVSCIV